MRFFSVSVVPQWAAAVWCGHVGRCSRAVSVNGKAHLVERCRRGTWCLRAPKHGALPSPAGAALYMHMICALFTAYATWRLWFRREAQGYLATAP